MWQEGQVGFGRVGQFFAGSVKSRTTGAQEANQILTKGVGSTIAYRAAGTVGIYFVAYADPAVHPEIRLELARDGKIIGAFSLGISAELKAGQPAPYLLSFPMSKLSPWTYDVSVVMRQGDQQMRRTVAVTLHRG